ncbi:MAG: peptide chain release factor-like protein [Coriobacteriia bacterium]|nr:peptide chain release factor-like protein [Coriobacteriia bacterium]
MDPDYTTPDSDRALLAECDVQVFRGTGPGGQSVNTTDSAVRLKHRPTGIVVTCRRERSQYLNKKTCLSRLRQRIAEAQHVDPERIPTRKSRTVKRAMVESKRVTARKKSLRKPVATDEE